MSWLTIVIVLCTVSSSLIIADDPCRFKDPSNGVIDLSTLAATDGKAAYPDTEPANTSNYTYSYNPCRPFSEGNSCVNVSVCQVSIDAQLTEPLGRQESAKWSAGNGMNSNPTVSYTYQENRVIVELVCSTNGTNLFEFLDENPTNTYKFRLTNKCACWNGCGASCDPPCDPACQLCQDGTCIIANDSCYIGHHCFTANQTAKNDSLLCLQCQPDENQRQWSFNPACSAGDLCLSELSLAEYICPVNITRAFYEDPDEAEVKFYNFDKCSLDRRACQAGFFLAKEETHPFACCPGYFCPAGQVCMIPCRSGAYCPSPLTAIDGTCQTSVKCPTPQTTEFELYGCGGSTFEGFCPDRSYCETPAVSKPCPNITKYCPTGVIEPLPCLSQFECVNGRVRRGYLYKFIFSTVFLFLASYIAGAMLFQWMTLKTKRFGRNIILNPDLVSNYFQEPNGLYDTLPEFQLNIYLNQAKLRDVTRFDPERNQGFTSRIVAGRITALMGGSGCGKSSLLDTIHGRRRLLTGAVRFAQHKPLSNELSDYIGYVPQADIMHDDLTVFETVYYSARTRRLNDRKSTIEQDVCFVLDKLGLNNMHNGMTKTLSGGQRKRVNIAMEIAACPKVLLLDEPTSGLDTASCDDLLDLLQLIKYSEAGPVAIIMVIHQPSHELFLKIDDIFFLTPLCCLAYQGPREQALKYLKRTIFEDNPDECPVARHNDSDTCFIMLTRAQNHLNNHEREHPIINQQLRTYPWYKRLCLPFLYVMSRSAKQIYVRAVIAEAAYLLAYFLLGSCVGYLFMNRQQDACDIKILSTIYFLISLAFGMLTCISSQRLFGVEIIGRTYERESRTHFHPVQYWLAKSFIDTFRLIIYPLIFLSVLYIEIVPRGLFRFYFAVMILLSFVCSGIGQFASVVFNRTEYAYLGATIIALLSCLLSGFSPRKSELGAAKVFVTFSFSRHVQHLLFRHETSFYVQKVSEGQYHLWSGQVEALKTFYSYSDNEHPYIWLISMGLFLRIVTFIILYIKSEYRSSSRFCITHSIPILRDLLCCQPCRGKIFVRNEYTRIT